jgi:hypothetical protein
MCSVGDSQTPMLWFGDVNYYSHTFLFEDSAINSQISETDTYLYTLSLTKQPQRMFVWVFVCLWLHVFVCMCACVHVCMCDMCGMCGIYMGMCVFSIIIYIIAVQTGQVVVVTMSTSSENGDLLTVEPNRVVFDRTNYTTAFQVIVRVNLRSMDVISPAKNLLQTAYILHNILSPHPFSQQGVTPH